MSKGHDTGGRVITPGHVPDVKLNSRVDSWRSYARLSGGQAGCPATNLATHWPTCLSVRPPAWPTTCACAVGARGHVCETCARQSCTQMQAHWNMNRQSLHDDDAWPRLPDVREAAPECLAAGLPRLLPTRPFVLNRSRGIRRTEGGCP